MGLVLEEGQAQEDLPGWRGPEQGASGWKTSLVDLFIFFLLNILSFLSLKLKKLHRCLLWFGIMIYLFEIYLFIHSFT